MRIPVNQISEAGWTRTLEIPLEKLARIVETHGPQRGALQAQVTLKNHRGIIGVRGTLKAKLMLACHLCLDRGPVDVESDLELMVVPEARWASGHPDQPHPEVQLASHDLDVSFYDGEELDLYQVLEDELLVVAPDSFGEEDEDDRCITCGRDVEAVLKVGTEAEEAQAFHPFQELAQRLKAEAETGDAEGARAGAKKNPQPKVARAKRRK